MRRRMSLASDLWLALAITLTTVACGGSDEPHERTSALNSQVFNTSDGGWNCVNDKCSKLGNPGDQFAVTPEGKIVKVEESAVASKDGPFINKRQVARTAGAPVVLSEDAATARVALLQNGTLEQCTLNKASENLTCEVAAILPEKFTTATLVRREDSSVGVVGMLDGKFTTCEAGVAGTTCVPTTKKALIEKFTVVPGGRGDQIVFVNDARAMKVDLLDAAPLAASRDGFKVACVDAFFLLRDKVRPMGIGCSGGLGMPDFSYSWSDSGYWGGYLQVALPPPPPPTPREQCFLDCDHSRQVTESFCNTAAAVGAAIWWAITEDPITGAVFGTGVHLACNGGAGIGDMICRNSCYSR